MSAMLRRLALLLAVASGLATASNALHPRGVSWTKPLGPELRERAVKAGLVPVGLDALRPLLKDGKTLLVDARPREKFEIGELPGAINLPWKEIEDGEKLPPPPRGRPIVVYCENVWCDSSLKLGQWLKARGYPDVALFVDGYEVWWNEDGAPR